MLDNLRDQASSSPFFQEEEPIEEKKVDAPPPRKNIDQITGMTAKQRFIISIMLLLVVCVLGVLIMMVTGKFALLF